MSQHNKTDFKHFTKAEMDDGLRLHGLEESKPSQLSDGFRSGAEWGASAVLAALVQRAPVEPLQRWGRSENLCLRLLDPMDDGYWTPWHIATEAIAQQRAKIEALSAEVERMKAPAELGFAMRAMTKTLDGLDVPYEEQLQIVPGLWQECMKERDQARAELESKAAELESVWSLSKKADEENDTLRAELAAIRATDKDAGLVAALKDAATSLETISRLAGRTHYVGDDGERVETYMGHHDQVRGYATSRASVARNALSKIGGV